MWPYLKCENRAQYNFKHNPTHCRSFNTTSHLVTVNESRSRVGEVEKCCNLIPQTLEYLAAGLPSQHNQSKNELQRHSPDDVPPNNLNRNRRLMAFSVNSKKKWATFEGWSENNQPRAMKTSSPKKEINRCGSSIVSSIKNTMRQANKAR